MNRALTTCMLIALLACLPVQGATENFASWTETDTGGYLAPSGTSLVATSVPRNQICYVYKNYGASYWNGDFSVNFQFVPGAVSHTSTDSFLGLCAFTNALYNWYHLSVNGGAGVTPVYSRDTTGYKLFLWMVKSGSEWYAFSDNIYVSLGTTYYVTFARDYDGGTYEKGLYTLTVCTGNYYGESGASLVGQETLNAPSAASTDFQYVLTGLSKMNGGVQAASGTISNLDLSGAPSEDPPSKVTGAYPPDDTNDVSLSATVSWSAAAGADNYDVYFGLSNADINDSYIGNQVGTSYDPNLAYASDYHWRIDANNAYGTTTGDRWNFSTIAEANEAAGVEDFTAGWIEIDPGSDIAITDANTITVTALPSNLSAYVYKDFGEGFFGGDLLLRERITVTASYNLGFFGALCLSNAPRDYQNMIWSGDDGILVYWREVNNVETLFLNVLVDGNPYTDSMTGTLSTEYFLTLSRDYDGGTNGAGLVTLYVCTGAHYGGAGSTLVDTLQVHVPAGGAQNFSHAMVAQSMTNQGTNTVSGTIEYLELGAPTGSGEDPEEPEPGDPNEPGEPGPSGHGPYYVSPNGSNDANGVTVNTPWRTLAYALDNAVLNANASYNVIYLMPGNHGGISLTSKTWASTGWTDAWRIVGMTGHTVSGIVVNGIEAFIDFNHIYIQRPSPDGGKAIIFQDCQSVKFRNSEVHGTWSTNGWRDTMTNWGIYVIGEPGYCDDILIDTCEFWDMNRAIHLYKDIRDDMVVQNCVAHRLNEDFIYLGDFASTRGDYEQIEILYNTYVDHPDENIPAKKPDGTPDYPHGTGLSFRGKNVLVKGHVAVATSGSAATRFYESFGPYDNVDIYDSIFIAPRDYARLAGFYQIGTGSSVVNCTFISGLAADPYNLARRYMGNVVIQPHADYDDSFIFKNNLIVGWVEIGGMTVDGGNNYIWGLFRNGDYVGTWDSNDLIVCSAGNTIRSGYTADWFEQTGNVFVGGPAFDDWFTKHVLPTAYQQFALPPSSPAVNAGQPSADSGYDVRGLGRGASPDIGAFEYVAGSAPLKPTGPTPANAATGVSLGTALEWSGTADNWDVYIGTSTANLTFQDNISARFYEEYDWDYETTYYWRIDANNATGLTTGDVWSFTTVAETTALPAKAVAVSPLNGARNVDTSINLRWGAVTGAIAYNVYYGTSSLEPLISTSSTSAAVTLSDSTNYIWRVDVVGTYGATTGDVWSFTTYIPDDPTDPGDPGTPGLPVFSAEGITVRPPKAQRERSDRSTARYGTEFQGLTAVEVSNLTGLPQSFAVGLANEDGDGLSGWLHGIDIYPTGTDTQWTLTITDSWGGELFSATDLDMTEGVVRYDYASQGVPFIDGLVVTMEDFTGDTAESIRVRLYITETWRR